MTIITAHWVPGLSRESSISVSSLSVWMTIHSGSLPRSHFSTNQIPPWSSIPRRRRVLSLVHTDHAGLSLVETAGAAAGECLGRLPGHCVHWPAQCFTQESQQCSDLSGDAGTIIPIIPGIIPPLYSGPL